MNAWLPALTSVFIVSILSLVGVITLALKDKMLKNILILLVSFSAGVLLGDSFIHLLPHAVNEAKIFSLQISIFVLVGILTFYILEKVILWRHCHHPGEEDCSVHGPKSFATMNLMGDIIHNFLDGLIIGGSYVASFSLGVATTLAVIFHEIPQEIGDFGVLLAGGYSKKKALIYNFLAAFTSFAGVILAILIASKIGNFKAFLVPFTAGGFIYIASSDLIPELHKQPLDIARVFFEIIFFVLGILAMWLLLYL